jgi:hypothetical protein
VHKSVEIKRGVEGVREVVKKIDLEGLHPDVRGLRRLSRLGHRRAIVAFEVVLGRLVRLWRAGSRGCAAGFVSGGHQKSR